VFGWKGFFFVFRNTHRILNSCAAAATLAEERRRQRGRRSRCTWLNLRKLANFLSVSEQVVQTKDVAADGSGLCGGYGDFWLKDVKFDIRVEDSAVGVAVAAM